MKLPPFKEIFIIIIVGIIVYLNALYGAVLSGDDSLIVNRTNLSQLNLDNILSFLDGFTYDIMGVSPFAFHLTNVGLHILTCVLLFFFLRIFFAPDPSLYGALIFTVLPIHTENVTWIAGKSHLLIGLAFLSVFLLFYYKKYWLAILLFFISVYPGNDKINIVNLWAGLIPVFIGIYLLTYKQFRDLLKLIPYFLIYAVIVGTYFCNIQQRVALTSAACNSNWLNPWIAMVYSTASHLSLMVFPSNLCIYHENLNTNWMFIFLGSFITIAVIGASILIYKRSKPLFLGLVLFYLFLAPSYSPFPLGWLIAERYAYTSSISLSILTAFILSNKLKPIIVPVLMVILALYAARTIDRNADYRTDERFWRATLRSAPLSPKARNEMGVIYARESNIIKAAQEFKNALRIKPDFEEAQSNLNLVISAVKKGITVKY